MSKPDPIVIQIGEPPKGHELAMEAAKRQQVGSAVSAESVEEAKQVVKQIREANNKNKHLTRKEAPIFEGVLQYFPDAIWEVARCSKIGNDQHNDPTLPMHWDRSKSGDEASALCRHLMQYAEMDDDGLLHATKVAWRGLALLQKTLEARGEAPFSDYNRTIEDEQTP